MKKTNIDIFQYMQYRQYLQAVYNDLKREDKNFSFRSFQSQAGFSKNSNHFWQILNGSIVLTMAAAKKYASALGLTVKEKAHLFNMITLEQAKNEDERELVIMKMLSSSSFLSEKKYQAAALVMFSDWRLPILYYIVSLDTFREDPAWIAANFFSGITPAEVTTGLEKLLNHGFISRGEDGKLRQEQTSLDDYIAASHETSAAVVTMRKKQLRKTMIKAIDAMDNQPFDKRLFYSSSISVPKELYEEMKQKVISFHENIRAIASKKPERDAVYQLNVQFYCSFDGSNDGTNNVS